MRKLALAAGVSLVVLTAFGQEPGLAPDKTLEKKQASGGGFHPTFDNIASGLGILLGVVAVVAYLDQRRAMRDQKAVIDFVKTVPDKAIAKFPASSMGKWTDVAHYRPVSITAPNAAIKRCPLLQRKRQLLSGPESCGAPADSATRSLRC